MAYYETYQWAWLLYLGASVGFYFSIYKMSKIWKSQTVRDYIRMVCAVVLFTPASHSIDGVTALAPAFIVTFAELLTDGFQAALQGLVPLLFALMLGAVLLAVKAFMQSMKVRQALKNNN